MESFSFVVSTNAQEGSLAEAEITDAVGETLRALEHSGHVIDWRIVKGEVTNHE